MLSREEAIKRREIIEALYSARAWADVRGKAEELAREIQLTLDEGRAPSGDHVAELCTIILRVEREARTTSWEMLRVEAQKLAREAAEAERSAKP